MLNIIKCTWQPLYTYLLIRYNGPCHVSGIFLPYRVKSLPLATIYEVKIPLRKWKKSLLQRNPAQMTSAIVLLNLLLIALADLLRRFPLTTTRPGAGHVALSKKKN
jgi:hypothetical protein